jgi:hypothetical protein
VLPPRSGRLLRWIFSNQVATAWFPLDQFPSDHDPDAFEFLQIEDTTLVAPFGLMQHKNVKVKVPGSEETITCHVTFTPALVLKTRAGEES